MATKLKRPGQAGKTVNERVGFALAHRVRVEILTLLNESVYTADEIAEVIGESRQNVHHHLKELLSGHSIEIAKIEKRRNADLHYYRAVEMPSFSEAEIEAMTKQERQDMAGLIVQHSTAELMAALAAGKLSSDMQICLIWRWINLDSQGRRKLAEEQLKWWDRVREIEAESVNRRAESGERATSYVVGLWGYERARTAPVPSPPAKTD